MGFFDFLGGKGAKEGWLGASMPGGPDRAEMDPESQRLLERQNQELSRGHGDLYNEEMQGVQNIYDVNRGQMADRGSLSASKFGESQDPAMFEAINRRSQRTMDKDLNQLQRQTQLATKAREQERLGTRSTMYSNEAQHKLNASMGRLKADVRKANARANAINSFISTGAQIAGTLIGGAGGAAATKGMQNNGRQTMTAEQAGFQEGFSK